MKGIIKRTLSFVLAVMMTISLLPMSALALDGTAFTMSAGSVTVDGTADKTVTVALVANSDVTVTAIQGTFSETSDYISLSGYEFPVTLSGTNGFNTTTGELVYVDDSTFTGFTVSSGNNVVVAQYTVDKNTPSGEYEVKFDLASVAGEDLEPTSEHSYYTAKIVVTNTSGSGSTDEYEVNVANSSSDLVTVGGAVALNVNVNNTFNSAKITLSYDTNYLTFVNGTVASSQTMGEKDQAVSITGENGVITIIDYGTAFASGTAYTLNFTAAAATTGSEVKVSYAGLSTAAQANEADLSPATTKTPVSVPIGYTVTVPTTAPHSFTASAGTVVPGGSVDIVGGSPYYTYELEAEGGTITPTEAGWTVSNVTGNVNVTIKSQTANSYDVTVKVVDKDGVDVTDDTNNKTTTDGATYNEKFTYTLPTDIDAGLEAGVKYSLKSITVGTGNGVYTTSDRTITIEGANVTGDIVITITREDLDPNKFEVTMEGETSAGTLEETQVALKGTAKLTLNNKEAGYTYTVTATMGGNTATVKNTDNVYTVESVNGKVVFTISKTLDTSDVKAAIYLSLDTDATQGNDLYLVYIETSEISGKTYQYNGQNFFYSAKDTNNIGYNAYCLLVEAASADAAIDAVTAENALRLVNTAAKQIVYTGDVNMTRVVDINDAQLVWNMYNVANNIITCNADTMEKYLRADVNGDKILNVAGDAVAVVSKAN